MATKRKSIIEEALLEAKSLEDALKANTKEMLASHMKEEIENIVESSLNEEDEEVEELISMWKGPMKKWKKCQQKLEKTQKSQN
jgi:exonuclease VII small subunit